VLKEWRRLARRARGVFPHQLADLAKQPVLLCVCERRHVGTV
jgi:hypothetical protein